MESPAPLHAALNFERTGSSLLFAFTSNLSEGYMKLKIVIAVLALFVFAGVIGLAADQDKKTTHKKTRTLTGCLAKSDDAKEFNLVTGKGGTWEIKRQCRPGAARRANRD